jgi:hypothetical protein
MIIIDTIFENDKVRLIKRSKAQRENNRWKVKNSAATNKGERKNSIKTIPEQSAPSFSFNMNMIYPKNVVTYSAYVKNLEGFINNSLNLKKDVKLKHIDSRESNCDYDSPSKQYTTKKSGKGPETMTASNKQINPSSNKLGTTYNSKLNPDSIMNKENHPSLRRRHARLFISVPKKSGFGFKIKYKDKSPTNQLEHPSLHHAQSELNTFPKKFMLKTETRATSVKPKDSMKIEEEWLSKSKFITKDYYFKIFSKLFQLKKWQITDIFDPPLTMREIKKIRKEKRKLYKIRTELKKFVSHPNL